MKVLLYGLNYAPEQVGIGKYSGEMAEWLANNGHEVKVICAPPYFPQWHASGNCYRKEWINGVEILRCPLWVPNKPGGITRLIHLASFAISSIPRLLFAGSWHPDVVITVAPAFFCAPGGLLLGKLSGQKTRSWLHIQDLELDAAFELGMLKGQWIRYVAELCERNILKKFDNISAISESMRGRIIAKGVRADRISVLPNWVDLQVIGPHGEKERQANTYRYELNLSRNDIVLQYSGSMNQKQGLEILVTAIELLADEPNLIWVLAGEGPTKAELAKKIGRRSNVIILPLQPANRMSDWLNIADIHLLPQKANAADLVLPSKLLGILASGRPVVASSPRGSELGELANQAGIRVNPEDGILFARAIRKLANDQELRNKLGANGRRIAEQFYDRSSVLGRFERVLSNKK